MGFLAREESAEDKQSVVIAILMNMMLCWLHW